jgi:hypothetical protein
VGNAFDTSRAFSRNPWLFGEKGEGREVQGLDIRYKLQGAQGLRCRAKGEEYRVYSIEYRV